MLNNLAPLTARDRSLAFLAADRAVRTTSFGIIPLPLLPPSKVFSRQTSWGEGGPSSI